MRRVLKSRFNLGKKGVRAGATYKQRGSYLRLYSTNSNDLVLFNVEKNVATLTLNRPDKLNALSVDLGEQFQHHVRSIAKNEDVRAVVITGAGKAFSAGGDMDFLLARTKSTPQQNIDEMLRFYNRFLTLRDLQVPVISAVNGVAIGAGMCLALATDFIITSKKNKMAINFVKLGLHPGLGVTHFLKRRVTPQVSNYLLLTGTTITGEEALKHGLVLEAVDGDGSEVLRRSKEYAEEIARASPHAVRLLTRTIRGDEDSQLKSALQREAQAQSESYQSKDMDEGLAAIREKRTPKF
eukprot:TRINITY_DN15743_c0_g1_i1.p1 TRINITY_DN15743_c0_g1~~TRINITY_DN15743_c0_g1_i1.p1  ORF type:complete len:296 (-),score=73.21 TRINITY_DN15743_c0_g1_i1:41-928(-)